MVCLGEKVRVIISETGSSTRQQHPPYKNRPRGRQKETKERGHLPPAVSPKHTRPRYRYSPREIPVLLEMLLLGRRRVGSGRTITIAFLTVRSDSVCSPPLPSSLPGSASSIRSSLLQFSLGPCTSPGSNFTTISSLSLEGQPTPRGHAKRAETRARSRARSLSPHTQHTHTHTHTHALDNASMHRRRSSSSGLGQRQPSEPAAAAPRTDSPKRVRVETSTSCARTRHMPRTRQKTTQVCAHAHRCARTHTSHSTHTLFTQ